jgi:hypothetical protein
VLVGAVALPFILRQNSWFEWSNTLWLLELQTAHVSAYGIPTFFTHAAREYFYPQQLFYAGPMLSVLSYPSVLFGAWPVFAAVTAGAFMAASAGMSWAARNLGVPSRLALIPGLLFAVTPYTISNLYGRGDWAEVVAVGALSVALGAATALLTGRGWMPGTVAALALAVAAIAGVHNLTLLFGALLAPVLAVCLLPLVPGTPAQLVGRYALVVAGALLGLALVAVFLVPNVWLSGRTLISHSTQFLTEVGGYDRAGIVLDPLPGQPAGYPANDIHTQTLVLPLIWLLVAGAAFIARSRASRRSAITCAGLVLMSAGLVLLITHPEWWVGWPSALTAIQFPFRLVTYVALATALAIAVLLAVPAVRSSRVAVPALVLVTIWQVALGGYLAIHAKARGATDAPTASAVRASVKPEAFQSGQQIQFRMYVPGVLPSPHQWATVAPIGDDTPPQVHLSGRQPAGSLVGTRVAGSPLIKFTGDVTVVGHTLYGLDIVRVKRSPWHATVSSECTTCIGAITGKAPLPLLAGRVITVAGVLTLLFLLVTAVRARRRVPGDPAYLGTRVKN